MAAKLILALDVKTYEEAKKIIDELHPIVEVFKVAGTLYLQEGNKVIETIHSKGRKVFLDMKFFDIPNQVRETSFAAARLGVEMFTIHTLGGREMVRGAIDGVMEASQVYKMPSTPLILGVTVLTSMNESILANELCVDKPLPAMVSHLAGMGHAEGLRGFVCSPHETPVIRRELGPDVTIVTPGVRMKGDSHGDQKRVMTPREAKEAGADYIVMGRSVLSAANRAAAVEMINSELK